MSASTADTTAPEGATRPEPIEGFIPDHYVPPPEVLKIRAEDVFSCLSAGFSDFKKAASYGIFFSSVYVIGGLGLVLLFISAETEFLIFPTIGGFLLIGPITAVGLYDVSRRLECGEPLNQREILMSFKRHGGKHLLFFGVVLVFLMIVWLKAATLIYAFNFGVQPLMFNELVHKVVTTADGLVFLAFGNFVGALLAALVFAISVVAVPLLLDKDTDFMTAITTSVRACLANPVAMFIWALIIGAMMLVSVATLLLGMFVALPVVGHATWHLYRRTVKAPDLNADPSRLDRRLDAR